MSTPFNPLNEQQLSALSNLSNGLNREQLLWLNGYFQGLLASSPTQLQVAPPPAQSGKSLKILFGTHTGRSKSIAEKLAQKLTSIGIQTQTSAMDDYKIRQLNAETNLVVIVSTHGEGEPPAMAEDFYTFITGKRAPKLENLNYSVVALGDKSYKLFCKTGLDIDAALQKAGAKPILPVLTLDVDFEDEAEKWINQFVEHFAEIPAGSTTNQSSGSVLESHTFSRKNPFNANVIDKVKITGRDSDKEVYHVELSLEGSGLTYEPGDSVGIWASNPPQLIEDILRKTGFSGEETVTLNDDRLQLRDALHNRLELTVLNPEVIRNYAAKTENPDLLNILNDNAALDIYLFGHDVLDLIEEFPFKHSAQDLVDVLRHFAPRLYSISSSQEAVGDEVHITVATVRYSNKGRARGGACSTYLSDRIEIDSRVSVFIEKNPAFKLPENEETPVILVGAGTGIAPFRAFLQHREAKNQKGKTWLFFGERRFHSDFLYQVEWQKLLKEGYLEKIDLAFSRDQKEKIYVQHRLLERRKEIYNWLNDGANIYLCGDMKQMARDVQQTLLQIFENEGGMSEEKAQEYLKKLKKEKRFQTDVY